MRRHRWVLGTFAAMLTVAPAIGPVTAASAAVTTVAGPALGQYQAGSGAVGSSAVLTLNVYLAAPGLPSARPYVCRAAGRSTLGTLDCEPGPLLPDVVPCVPDPVSGGCLVIGLPLPSGLPLTAGGFGALPARFQVSPVTFAEQVVSTPLDSLVSLLLFPLLPGGDITVGRWSAGGPAQGAFVGNQLRCSGVELVQTQFIASGPTSSSNEQNSLVGTCTLS